MKEHILVLESGLALSWLDPAEIYMSFYSGTQAEGAAPIGATVSSLAEKRNTETEVNPPVY